VGEIGARRRHQEPGGCADQKASAWLLERFPVMHDGCARRLRSCLSVADSDF